MAMIAINADTPVMMPNGEWGPAGGFADLGVYQRTPDGRIIVPEATVMQVPGGNQLSAGAAAYLGAGQPGAASVWNPAPSLPTQPAPFQPAPDPNDRTRGGILPDYRDYYQPAPGTSTPGAPGLTAAQRDARAVLTETLAAYGLDTLSDWAWNMVVQGFSTAEILIELRKRPEYAARFPGMALRAKEGLPAISEAEYIATERAIAATFRAGGITVGALTSRDYIGRLIGNDWSPQEVAQVVQDAYVAVADLPDEVRGAYLEYLGADGMGALAAQILDPDAALADIERMAARALVAGTTRAGGLQLGGADIERVGALDLDYGRLAAATADAGSLAHLGRETITEADDLGDANLLDATLGLDDGAVRRRAAQRQAATQGGGGAALTQGGLAAGTGR